MSIDVDWLSARFPDLLNLSPLGDGGQKWVFSATDDLKRDVVLKIIKPSEDPDRVAREIDAVRAVRSDHVPIVHEVGQVDTPLGRCIWLKEQRVRGSSLREVLAQGPLGWGDWLRLSEEMLVTLAEAERVHIVHRDVKPGNIMRDLAGRFWLLDFGVARHLDLESLTATRARFGLGTVGYAPPEQMRNIKPKIDHRCDLFALGVVLYESASGVNPFRAGAANPIEVLRRVEQMPLPPLRLPPDTQELGDFVATLTQKYPDRRPRTVSDALAWFQEIRARL